MRVVANGCVSSRQIQLEAGFAWEIQLVVQLPRYRKFLMDGFVFKGHGVQEVGGLRGKFHWSGLEVFGGILMIQRELIK